MPSTKFTVNKLLLSFFCATSILPIVILGVNHVHYIHRILNKNQPFLKLIEHEEFILFCIYLATILVLLLLSIIVLRILVINPLREVLNQFKRLVNEGSAEPVKTKIFSLFEIENFIGSFNTMVHTLKQAKQQQDEFIATLTHDLKVPILAQQKAFELLSNYDLEQEKKALVVNSLNDSNKNLLELINSLLDSYKIEAGNFKLSKEPVEINSLINESITALYPFLEEKNIKLKLNLEDNPSIKVDKTQIKRVLKNILHNAIKNSHTEGLIEIKTMIDNQRLKLIITDQGCGIAEDQLKSIFEKYKSDSQGLGLGLYISRLIIEAHQGSITVSSTINKGSSFEINLALTDT